MINPSTASWTRFLNSGLLQHPLVDNVSAPIETVTVGGSVYPVTLNHEGLAQTSWVASLRNSYGPYARAETQLIAMSKLAKAFYCAASYGAEELLLLAGLRGGAYLNNWQLATNLYDSNFTCETICTARDQLHHRHTNLPVIVRSLVSPLHQPLMNDLVKHGFHLIPTRQVWLLKDLSQGLWRRRTDIKRDFALSRKETGPTEWISGTDFTPADMTRAQSLYDQLYRGKYPAHNPAYNEHFFQIGVASGWLHLFGLRYPGQALSGIVGLIQQENWWATPVLGYDLSRPQSEGLYRRLMLRAFLTAEAAGGHLHCSGGAGLYKKLRGAQPSVEFAAISSAHLNPLRQQALVGVTRLLWKIAVPYLETHIL